ncbi:hypothetical protein AX16_007587 [Volvariella volvacea WC 439]|nr:hypothetical protein AX16_007587 [Volvariella volvacea WC 439]
MPSASIADSTGTTHNIYFIDTGPVPGSNDYHTIFLHHGTAFNGEIFRRTFPFAPPNNLRFVAPIRRDYGKSDRYTDEEVADLVQGKNVFLQNLGAEVANFLAWFLDNNEIPKLSEDRKKGGLSLLGWSMGNAPTLAFFGQSDAIPSDVYKKVKPYIRDLIVYELPLVGFGFDRLAEGYHARQDPALKTPEEIGRHTLLWLTTYYKHAPDFYASAKLDGRFDIRRNGDDSSLNRMTPEDKAEIIQWGAAMRSDIAFAPYDKTQKILSEQANRALWDERLAKTVLPSVKVITIVCTSSTWYCAWGNAAAREKYAELEKEGKKVRPVSFVEFPGMNHFGHWDEPERWVKLLTEALARE